MNESQGVTMSGIGEVSETTEYLTRDGVHVLLKEHGFPIGRSTIDKIAMRTCDPVTRARYKGGPPVAAYVPGPSPSGFRPLYEPAAVLEWARSLLIKPNLNGGGSRVAPPEDADASTA
jgi:hypothetical protein